MRQALRITDPDGATHVDATGDAGVAVRELAAGNSDAVTRIGLDAAAGKAAGMLASDRISADDEDRAVASCM